MNKQYKKLKEKLIIPQNEVTTKFKVIQPDIPTGTTPDKLPFEPLSFEAPQLPELEQIKNPAFEEGKFQDQKVYLHNTPSLKLEGGFEKSTND
ncbi:hypothetical protein J5893_00815, partial [bacterium]|nr:hypothetical protein [bacterium]